MPFGKYRGTRLRALDDGYLQWLRTIELREPLRTAVEREWRRRVGVDAYARPGLPHELRDAARRIITAGYRAVAREAHPDVGGDTARMQAVNAAAEALRRLVEA